MCIEESKKNKKNKNKKKRNFTIFETIFEKEKVRKDKNRRIKLLNRITVSLILNNKEKMELIKS